MENASKALILAGSILIAIIIISLGVILFNNMSGTVEKQANLTQQKIQAFNEKLQSFIGESVSSSQVNQLITTVIAINNKSIADNDEVKLVKLTYEGKIIEVKNGVLKKGFSRVNPGYYEVKVTPDSNGLFTSIEIIG